MGASSQAIRMYKDGDDLIMVFPNAGKDIEAVLMNMVSFIKDVPALQSDKDDTPQDPPKTDDLEELLPDFLMDDVGEPEFIESEVIEPEVVEPEVVEPEVVEPEVVEPEPPAQTETLPTIGQIQVANKVQLGEILISLYPRFKNEIEMEMKKKYINDINRFTSFSSEDNLRKLCLTLLS